MGEVATLAPKGLGSQNPTKKWVHSVDRLGQPKNPIKKLYVRFKFCMKYCKMIIKWGFLRKVI